MTSGSWSGSNDCGPVWKSIFCDYLPFLKKTSGKFERLNIILGFGLLVCIFYCEFEVGVVPTTAEANLANLEVKSTEFSMPIKNNCRSTSDPVDCTLSSLGIIFSRCWDWMFPRKELRSGIHVSLDTAREGEVGGVGRTRGGVWSTELLEFSRTESKKWSALVLVPCPSKKERAEVRLSLLLPLSNSGGLGVATLGNTGLGWLTGRGLMETVREDQF